MHLSDLYKLKLLNARIWNYFKNAINFFLNTCFLSRLVYFAYMYRENLANIELVYRWVYNFNIFVVNNNPLPNRK